MTTDEAIHYAECLKNNYTIDLNQMKEFCDKSIEALHYMEDRKELYALDEEERRRWDDK